MDVVLGLGSAGCRIADTFSQYSQYEVFKIDAGLTGENCFSLPAGETHQQYEERLPDITGFVESIPEGDVLFVVGGSGYVSGASLKILQHLKDRKISILYVKPDVDMIGGDRALQERLVYRVLQEYARSGVFERIYLVYNPSLEKLLGDVPIKEYYQKLNEMVVNTIHMINVFRHTDAVQQQSMPRLDASRITTFGIVSLEKNEESFFFPLDNVGEIDYYYGINDSTLEEDTKLFGKIKERVREKKSGGTLRINYFVHSTKYVDPIGYCAAHSNQIQFFPEKDEKELDKP